MPTVYELLRRVPGRSPADFERALRRHADTAQAAGPRYRIIPVSGPGPRGEPFPFDAVVRAEAGRTSALPGHGDAVDAADSYRFEVDEATILEGSGPFNLTIFSKRNQALSPGQYRSYLHDHHGPLTVQTRPFSRHLRGYRQGYIRPGTLQRLDGGPLSVERQIDGMMQMWFADRTEMQAAYATPEYWEIMHPDEEEFVTRGYSIAFTSACYSGLSS